MTEKFKPLPPADYLRDCFSYDPMDGLVIWKIRPIEHFASASYQDRWNAKYAGKISGRCLSNRTIHVVIGDKDFQLHRVIWKMITGEDPPSQIDHRDGNPSHNNWDNLRLATPGENQSNRAALSNNVSGLKGAHWWKRPKKWASCIRAGRKRYFLGFHDTPEAAHAAYCEASVRLHGAFSNTKRRQ